MTDKLERFLWVIATLVLMIIVCLNGHAAVPKAGINEQMPSSTKEPLTTPRDLCTWDITFVHRLGQVFQGRSKHAWMLTAREQFEMFNPFLTGADHVLPGSWYQCGLTKVTLGGVGPRVWE
jgi:hypothetical protein